MLPFSNYYIPSPSVSEKNVSNNNGNKRRKKKRPMSVYGGEGGGGGGGGDGLEVVKAAAWAWYLRKEGKPIMREFDLTRAPKTPRPSRYKIEATKNMILSENRVLAENRVSKSSLWYTNHPFRGDQETQYSHLLDTYEITNISKRLINIDDSSFSASSSNVLWHNNDNDHHNHNYNDNYGRDDHGLLQKINGYENISTTSSRANNEKSYNGGFMKKVSKRSLWKGMIVMGPGSTVCGRSDDVASQAGRRTVKVAVAAEALVRSAASSKTHNGRR